MSRELLELFDESRSEEIVDDMGKNKRKAVLLRGYKISVCPDGSGLSFIIIPWGLEI